AKCGADNREGRKFCAECGETLASKCPRCGATNESREKFCGECGAALGTSESAAARKSNEPRIRIAETIPPENLEGERKTGTALFADIKRIDGPVRGPRPRGSPGDRRSGAQADDGGGAALRRLRRPIDR